MNAPVLLQRQAETNRERLARVMQKVPEIRTVLGELFPGSVEMRIEEDPEIADFSYLTFRVETRESLPKVLESQLAWCDEKRRLLGDDCELVSLDPIILE